MRIQKLFLLMIVITGVLLGCAPDATDSYGRPIRISSLKGKWVVINYWATWCPPCIQEITELNRLAKYYKNQVVVLGVAMDNLDNPALSDLAQGYGVNYAFLKQFPIERWANPPKTLPVTYILDKKGHLFKILVGPQTLATFQTLLQLPPPTLDL